MVPVQIQRRVLPFAVNGLVQLLDDLGPGGFGAGEVRVHIVDKHGQRLCSVAQFRRSPALRTFSMM